jgi:hypothetical protein
MAFWDIEGKRQARLEALVKEGHSNSVIADMLSIEFKEAITRNGVIGRRMRTGLASAKTNGARRATSQMSKSELRVAARQRALARAEAKGREVTPEYVEKVTARLETVAKDSWQERPVAYVPPIEQQVTWDELDTHHCRWPIGDTSTLHGHTYCGGKKLIGISYCEHHARISVNARPAQSSGMVARPIFSVVGGYIVGIGSKPAKAIIPAAGGASEPEKEDA